MTDAVRKLCMRALILAGYSQGQSRIIRELQGKPYDDAEDPVITDVFKAVAAVERAADQS